MAVAYQLIHVPSFPCSDSIVEMFNEIPMKSKSFIITIGKKKDNISGRFENFVMTGRLNVKRGRRWSLWKV